jgi:hypothetical protein
MKKSLHLVGHVLLGAIVIAAFGAIVMSLWNALLPQIFGITTINFWQALGLLVLCRMLFGSLGKNQHLNRIWGCHKNPIHEKWHNMTPEERKNFIKHRHFHHSSEYKLFDDKEPEKKN